MQSQQCGSHVVPDTLVYGRDKFLSWDIPGFLAFLRLRCMLAHSEVSSLRHVVYVPEDFEEKPQGALVLRQNMT